jgi:hypothetical protein
MFDTTMHRALSGAASAFIAPTGVRGNRPGIWAETGHAIELAYCQPAPMGPVVRVAVVIGAIVAAKLYAAVALIVVAKLCAIGFQ